MSSRRLYSVSIAALRDRGRSDERVAETIFDHGDKGASDGLESDTDGNLYVTAYEHSVVLKRSAGWPMVNGVARAEAVVAGHPRVGRRRGALRQR
ncbi:SMP-30/gluconolactonase/LRE family protein [Mycobacterium tilburgii]|uniref:L-dopachrome tautomerase-related protein n=1 Tax=Mycobacterium tilburgii TaxID=44467 RepID=UPI00118292B4|nr:L-dopachrome tautomerase-related protein [Mycobacterium tilburgii]